MSPHVDTLFWYWAHLSLLFLLSAACLAEKQLIPIIWEITLVNSEADESVASVRCQTDSTAIHMSNSTTHIQPDSLVRNQSSCSLSIKPVRSKQQPGIDIPLTIQQPGIDVPVTIQQSAIDIPLTIQQSAIDIPLTIQQSGIDVPVTIQQSAIDVPLNIQQSAIDIPLIIQQPGVDVTLTYNSQGSTYRNYTTARYRRTVNNINWQPCIDVPLTIQSDSQASTYR